MKKLLGLVMILSIFGSCSIGHREEKNVLNVYSYEVIPGLDPMVIADRHSHTAARQIYEGLYEYHYLKNNFEIYPVLADGMPEITNKGLTYTVKLKKGVTFADDPCFKQTKGKGRELTADDFIYSIKRGMVSSYTKGLFFNSILADLVVGLDEFKKASEKKDFHFDQEVAGMKALDKYTIQFNLKKTSVYFPGILTRPNAFVVAKEAVDQYGPDFKFHPVGSGPFKLQEWEKESKLVLVRNPNYKHGTYPTEGAPEDKDNGMLKDAGAKLPFLAKVVRYILVEEQPRWLNFNRGLLDIVTLDKDSYYDAFPTGNKLADNLKERGIKVIRTPQLDIYFYTFNMEDKIIGKNKYLRQAISLAYDGQKYNALFYNSQAYVANWILPPGIFGFDPAYKNPYRQYNIAKAKKLMAKAGYPNGKGLAPITMLIPDSIASKQMAEHFAKSLEDIGVKIVLRPMNFGLLLNELEQERNFQIASLKWRADLPFPEDFLRTFYSKAFSPGPNHAKYSNAEYDKLFEKVSQLPQGPEKLRILNKMRDLIAEQAIMIPLVNPVQITLTQPYVYNYRPHVLVGDIYKYVKIDLEQKKQVQKKYYR
jgi:ABC-type transport system substrate-binding protein